MPQLQLQLQLPDSNFWNPARTGWWWISVGVSSWNQNWRVWWLLQCFVC